MVYIKKILNHSFFKESVIYGLTGALSKISVFLTVPIFTRYLSVEQFGILDLYMTIGMLLYIVLEMQIASGFMRTYYEKQKNGELDKLVGTAISYYFLSYVTVIYFFIVLTQLNIQSKYLIYDYILPIILAILPKQIFDLNNIVMRMEHLSKQYMFYNISYILVVAIFNICSIILINPKIEYILWSTFIANFIFSIISYVNIKKRISIFYSFKFFKEIFYYGAPIVPAVIAGWAMNSIGKIYISKYLSDFDLGIYSLALKISMIYSLLIQAFRLAWQPYIIKKFEENNKAKETFIKALNYYVIIGLLFIVFIWCLSPLIIDVLATNEYKKALNVIPILLLSNFWQGGINIVAVGNVWVRKTYLNSIGNISGSISVLIFTYILMQKFGLVGIATAQLIGFILSFFIILYFSQKNIYIKYNLTFFIGIIAIFTLGVYIL